MFATICRAACGAGVLVSLCGCQADMGLRRGPSVLRRDAAKAQRLNEDALALVAQKRLAEAESCLRQALEADPYYPPAHNNLGVVLLQQAKLWEAGWELRHASQLMPKAAAPRANLGLLYEAAGRLGSAEENLQQALKLAPDDIEIIGLLARVHVRQGKCTPDTLAWLETITTQDDNPAWRNWAREKLTITTPTHSKKGDEP